MAKDYAEDLEPQPADNALEGFSRAFSGLAQGIGSAWFPPELQARAEETRQKLHESASDPQRQLEITRHWVTELAQAGTSEQVQGRLQTAYQNYVHELQNAWSSVDPSQIGPWQLAAIGHSQRVAAAWVWWAYCTSWYAHRSCA